MNDLMRKFLVIKELNTAFMNYEILQIIFVQMTQNVIVISQKQNIQKYIIVNKTLFQ